MIYGRVFDKWCVVFLDDFCSLSFSMPAHIMSGANMLTSRKHEQNKQGPRIWIQICKHKRNHAHHDELPR